MKKWNVNSLRLNKKQVSALNQTREIVGGVQSDATNCMSPAACTPSVPVAVIYAYCVPNNGPCIGSKR